MSRLIQGDLYSRLDAGDRVRVKLPSRLEWQQGFAEMLADPAVSFALAVMGRRAGKTHCLSDTTGEFCLERPCVEVAWVAPTHDLSEIGRRMFKQMWRPVIQQLWESNERREALLENGSRVFWRSADNPDSLLGRGYDLVIVDEAARVNEEAVKSALLPALMDRNGKMVAITTPKGRRSWVHEWYLKSKAKVPGYAHMRGPSTENPNPHIKKWVDVQRREMPELYFRQEILAEFVEGAGAVFRNVRARALLEKWRTKPKAGAAYVIGCDLAKHQDYTQMYALDVSTGQVHGQDRLNQLDWPTIKERVKLFCEAWNGPLWLDSTGLGDPIFDDLTAMGVPAVPVKFSTGTKSQLVTTLTNALEKGEVSYPEDDILLGELESFGYEELPSGRFRYSAPSGMHDDCVVALALAVHAMKFAATNYETGWLE